MPVDRGDPSNGGRPRSPRYCDATTGSTTVAGALVRIDDFFVSLRDDSGGYHAFDRGPAVTVVVTDPLAAHHDLLDRYTDADMHNLTAYLATLK